MKDRQHKAAMACLHWPRTLQDMQEASRLEHNERKLMSDSLFRSVSHCKRCRPHGHVHGVPPKWVGVASDSSFAAVIAASPYILLHLGFVVLGSGHPFCILPKYHPSSNSVTIRILQGDHDV